MSKVDKLEAELVGTVGEQRHKILNDLIRTCLSFSAEKATHYSREAIKIQESSNSMGDRITTFYIAAKAYIENGDNDNARKHINTALDMAEKYGDLDQILLVSILQSEFFVKS